MRSIESVRLSRTDTSRRASDARPAALCKCLCGQCHVAVNCTGTRFPDEDLARRASRSLKRLAQSLDSFEPVEHGSEPHELELLEPLPLPAAPSSSFSSRLRCGLQQQDLMRLEAKLLQTKVRQPLQENHVEASNSCTRFRESKDELETGALRLFVQKAPEKRRPHENQLILQFLAGREFFRDLSEVMLKEISVRLRHVRYDPDDTVLAQGQPAHGIALVIRGIITGVVDYSRGAVLGLDDILEDRAVLTLRSDPVWAASLTAGPLGAEVMFLAKNDLVPIFQDASMRERMWVLRDIFPQTRGKKPQDLCALSRVERDGQRVPIVDLFQVGEVPRHHVFFTAGENAEADARISIVLSGSVQMKASGRVRHEASTGAVLGEEAWMRRAYQTTAVCVSAKCRIMSIAVSDFVEQFLSHGRMEKREQEELQKMLAKAAKRATIKPMRLQDKHLDLEELAEQEDLETEAGEQIPPSRVRRLTETLRRPVARKADAEALRQAGVLQQLELPARVAPWSGCQTGGVDWDEPEYTLGGGRLWHRGEKPPRRPQVMEATGTPRKPMLETPRLRSAPGGWNWTALPSSTSVDWTLPSATRHRDVPAGSVKRSPRSPRSPPRRAIDASGSVIRTICTATA